MSELLFHILDYMTILPAAVMCVLPVLDHSKIKPRVLLPVMSAAIIVSAVLLGIIRELLAVNANAPLFVFLVPAATLYFMAFDVKKTKLWFIFISTMAVFSFGGLATHIVKAMTDPGSEFAIELLAKWLVSLLFLLGEIVFLKQLRWLLENDNINAVCRFIWAVPVIVTAANIYMIPQNYANVRVGRIFQLYIMVEALFAVFFIVILIMLYRTAKAITDKAESEQNARLLGMQAAQYENLKKYMDSTARLRHDFIYMAKTAQALAANGKTAELQKLLHDYGTDIDSNATPPKYCEHTALNAITAYYASEAKEAAITLTARLNVSQNIIISDYELCSVAGNILDNAVAAAREVKGRPAQIVFVADTKPNGDLYLAVSNPYNGIIKKTGKKFTSTKSGGHGIGLESVKAIVDKNNGYCNFHYDGKTFYSEIMLRQV